MSKRSAREIALAVHEQLGAYIVVHDAIFGGSVLRKLLPIPGFFQRIRFDEHEVTLSRIRDCLRALNTEASQDTSALGRGVTAYGAALLGAVEILRDISERMAAKAEGTGSTSKEDYLRRVNAYQAAVERYREEGTKLNALMQGR